MESQKPKGNILYVEDEVDSLRTMIEFLNPRGFGVIVALTAEEAYERLKKYNPDLIIVDIKLVGDSGIDFIERIQKKGINTPVIVITGYAEQVAEIKDRELNIYGYYIKPFSYAELYKTIKEILEGS